MQESPIFTRTYDLLRWLLPVTVRFPRQHRFVLAQSLQRTALELQERLIEASRGPRTLERLQAADVTLTKLRFYLRLSHDLGLLPTRGYAHGAQRVDEIGRLLGAWIKAQNTKQRRSQSPGP